MVIADVVMELNVCFIVIIVMIIFVTIVWNLTVTKHFKK